MQDNKSIQAYPERTLVRCCGKKHSQNSTSGFKDSFSLATTTSVLVVSLSQRSIPFQSKVTSRSGAWSREWHSKKAKSLVFKLLLNKPNEMAVCYPHISHVNTNERCFLLGLRNKPANKTHGLNCENQRKDGVKCREYCLQLA